jgi:hypothetical protein
VGAEPPRHKPAAGGVFEKRVPDNTPPSKIILRWIVHVCEDPACTLCTVRAAEPGKALGLHQRDSPGGRLISARPRACPAWARVKGTRDAWLRRDSRRPPLLAPDPSRAAAPKILEPVSRMKHPAAISTIYAQNTCSTFDACISPVARFHR